MSSPSLWTSTEIAEATGGTASAEFEVSGIAYDSREVGPGDLFVALKGESTDGHHFVPQAFAQGGGAAIVSEPVAGPHILVEDTARALDALGRAARARTEATIVGVTGSVGKTGTKEALHAALERAVPGGSHRSVKSYNNHVGVPLSLARMPRGARYGVFEMGMNHAGELAALTRLVRPHVAIVTAIAPAHAAHFADEAAIADAKGEIFQGLEPGGTAIVPFDSPHRDRLLAAAEPHAGRILTFGVGADADVRGVETFRLENGGTLISARVPGDVELTFTIGLSGDHWVSNALAVIAVAHAAGADLPAAGLALSELRGMPGRGERRRVMLPGGEATIVDESYNANPASMAATIAELGRAHGRRIAVLGGMRELGVGSDAHHVGLAEPLVQAGVARAILVGDEMAPLASSLEGRIETAHVLDAAAAQARLTDLIAPGDTVLVKGSNAFRLGRLVEALAAKDD